MVTDFANEKYTTVIIICGLKEHFMSYKKTMDLRVRRTKDAIKETFKNMMCEMPPDKITVKELAERARINRKTFYLHYTSIEGLYNEMLQIVAKGYYDEVEKLPIPTSIADLTNTFFRYFSSQGKYVENLICNPDYQIYCNQLFRATLKHNRDQHNPYEKFPETKQQIINLFLVNSTLDIYREWIASGKEMAIEDIIDLTGKLLYSGIQGLESQNG
jgi:AcrR family transcriptional regulator